jgi:hypothetical protein
MALSRDSIWHIMDKGKRNSCLALANHKHICYLFVRRVTAAAIQSRLNRANFRRNCPGMGVTPGRSVASYRKTPDAKPGIPSSASFRSGFAAKQYLFFSADTRWTTRLRSPVSVSGVVVKTTWAASWKARPTKESRTHDSNLLRTASFRPLKKMLVCQLIDLCVE